MKKKYVLKKEPVLPQPQPEKPPQLTLELIRRFVSEAKFDTLPKVQLPRRKLLPAGGLERASSTRPNKPQWRAEDGPEMVLKRQLTASSSNGGWTAGIRQQSLIRNLALLNELKFTLNILAEDNFQQLLQHLRKCLSDNFQEGRQLFQQVVLCKAEFQTKYHGLYARLCRELTTGKGELQAAQLNERLVDRLKRTQLVYLDLPEEEYADNKQRKNFMNTLEFFGELFLAGVVDRVSLNLVTHCHLNEYFAERETDLKSLEVLVVLYNNVGKYEKNHPEEAMRISKIDGKLYPKDSEAKVTFSDMFILFENLTETVEDTRLWSLITNMLERRNNKWPKGQNTQPEQPEPIQPQQASSPSGSKQVSAEQKEDELRQQIIKAIQKINIQELQALARRDQLIFTDLFVLHFFRHKLPQIEQLVQLMAELIDAKVIQLDCLVQSFELKFEELVLEEADFPLCRRALCKLFHPYAQAGNFSFEQLREFVASDEQQEFVEALESMMNGLLQSERES